MPASVSAGDLLLVALKMPPSRIGTYLNFTPLRFSIAGIASWLRKAFGLPKSNMNCGAVGLTAVSLMCGVLGGSFYMMPIIPSSLAGWAGGINRLAIKCPFCECHGVAPHVRGPFCDQVFET